MKKYYFKIIIITAILSFASAGLVSAKLLNDDITKAITPEEQTSQAGKFAWSAGFSFDATVMDVVYVVVQAFLALLGTIFLALIIYAGFLWMTAGGNEDQLKKAKGIIQKAVIGFLIIACSYAITSFVFKQLPGGQRGTTSGPVVI
ncbi:MAG: hypothetical protein ABH881_03505 [bacterium]